MIHSFSFRNFCSFKGQTNLDFTVSKQTPNSNLLEKSDADLDLRINKVNWFAGPNASGKTSLFKAFAFLSFFASESLYSRTDSIPVDPFRFSAEAVPIEFELIFEVRGILYKYFLQLTEHQVLREELSKRNDTKFYTYLFKRQWDNEQQKSIVISQDIGLNDKAITEVLKNNVSVLSAARVFKNDFLEGIHSYFDRFKTNVKRYGRTPFQDDSSRELEKAGVFYQKEADLFLDVKNFLASVDLGIGDIQLKVASSEAAEAKGNNVIPVAIHNVAGNQYELRFVFESSGTKNLFVLMGKIFEVLRDGGTAVLDEFDTHLHPHILPKIVNLFIDPDTNPKGAQLFFSTHSVEMFIHLEKEQIFLIEKNDKSLESEVYRLDQIPGIRRDDNLYAKYMGGKFGSTPNI